jgi:hypothetical protein
LDEKRRSEITPLSEEGERDCDSPAMRRLTDRFRRDAQLRLATLTAGCLLAEAVIAKNVLEVDLDCSRSSRRSGLPVRRGRSRDATLE